MPSNKEHVKQKSGSLAWSNLVSDKRFAEISRQKDAGTRRYGSDHRDHYPHTRTYKNPRDAMAASLHDWQDEPYGNHIMRRMQMRVKRLGLL